MILAEAASYGIVADAEIGHRVVVSPRAAHTRQYIALDQGRERAFISLDCEPDHLVLYELWVPRAQRGRGIATAVLAAVEVYATSIGYSLISLRAEPLDKATDRDRLVRFYRTNGYERSAGDPTLMFKRLSS